jgi:hypothetical protein
VRPTLSLNHQYTAPAGWADIDVDSAGEVIFTGGGGAFFKGCNDFFARLTGLIGENGG